MELTAAVERIEAQLGFFGITTSRYCPEYITFGVTEIILEVYSLPFLILELRMEASPIWGFEFRLASCLDMRKLVRTHTKPVQQQYKILDPNIVSFWITALIERYEVFLRTLNHYD